MKLGGWHRLWLVLCVVYLLLVVGVSATLLPGKGSLSESAIRLRMSPDNLRLLIPLPAIGEEVRASLSAQVLRVSFEGRTVLFQAGTPDSVIGRVLSDYDAATSAAAMSARQRFVIGALSWWALPCVAVYLAGRSIRWVFDGFRVAR